MKNTFISIAVILLAITLLFGCVLPTGDDASNTPPPQEEQTAEVPETTKVLTQPQMDSISALSDESIFFSQPTSFETGDVIISGISANTPTGLLRKVERVSNSGQEITTSQASLEDAIQSCNIQFSNRLTSSSVRQSDSIKGASRATAQDGFDFGINIDNVVLYDSDGNPSTTTDQIKANGALQFNLVFGFLLEVDNFKIEQLSFEGEIEEHLDIEITGGEIGASASERILITEYNFSPFVAAVIPSIPPVPIVIIPKITVYLDLYGSVSAELTAKVEQGASLNSALNYDGSYWTPIVQFEKYFHHYPPTFTSQASVKVSAGSMLALSLYGVAGPYIDTSAYLQANASTNLNTIYWEILGGFEAKSGVAIAALGKSLVDYNTTLLDYEQLLESGEQNSTPEPTNDRFTDMGNGTIRDNETGLIWTKNANIVFDSWYSVSSPYETDLYSDNWEHVNQHVSQLSNGDFGLSDGSSEGDWRIPSIWEIIRDDRFSNPALPDSTGDQQWTPGNPFDNLRWGSNLGYWTRTTRPGTEELLVVSYTDANFESYSPNSFFCVWPVRDARPDEL